MKKKEGLVRLEVEGMDCNNCAAHISRYLDREGLQDVFVNFQTREVRFRQAAGAPELSEIKAGINRLGYEIVTPDAPVRRPWWTLERKLIISALFTLPLLLHHLLMMAGTGIPGLSSYWAQLVICIPPFTIGFFHFGRSAWLSLRSGVPNMDVLIFIGSSAAFIYSLIGTLIQEHDYIFYETSATIITLVLAGNWLEKRAVARTTSAIGELTRLQVDQARKVTPSGELLIVDRDTLEVGDVVQVNEGDKIPTDGLILHGQATINESMLTGESTPVERSAGERVVGSSLVESGNIRMQVEAVGEDTVLRQMIELVRTAQQDKPRLQRLADRISAIFVPVVLLIALFTFLIGYGVFSLSSQQAMMNAIAVLVISCPCALGLATPTAVMVGVGRLAREGILVKGGQTVEAFAGIRQFVFDKTGTLTTGRFRIRNIDYHTDDHKKVNALIYQLEQHSSHPIARSLVREMAARRNGADLGLLQVEEMKGVGVRAVDEQGLQYQIGSIHALSSAKPQNDARQLVVLTAAEQPLATIEIEDELREEAKVVIDYLEQSGRHTIIMSGDTQAKTAEVAQKLGVEDYYAAQSPEEKVRRIQELSRRQPTVMVGDGINDAPALAGATIGVSLSDASQAAIQSAQVVLLGGQLKQLPRALEISRATVRTVRQSLFWAFAYNIVAIPIAAVGLLNPMWGALFMAFSDVVVIGNAIRLRHRRI